ncbi:hypothetical protein D0S48_12625 [Psychrobacillus sp. AK 1817]|uniref:M3 family metallopeptidase n=1 Tax=Psychrobacillus sp. AK 1817 TaxID=2303505 RepID=UPI0012469335|nr:M3 family metallopeptidase [Psychrobacillus sp. AK 1817]QEY21443.1 hypothetical protein D0S48_12625 [Psychrobacillus sp. AK 1817]
MENKKEVYESLLHTLEDNLLRFSHAQTWMEQDVFLQRINEDRIQIECIHNEANLNFRQDRNNLNFKEIHDSVTEKRIDYDSFNLRFYDKLLQSKFKKELKKKWGEQLFRIARIKTNTFSKDIIEDLRKENQLINEYNQLLTKLKANYKGVEVSITKLRIYMFSSDDMVRKQAQEAMYNAVEDHEEKFDQILDSLVTTRTSIAKKLGYASFTPLGYARLHRTDIQPSDVQKYRFQVKEHAVPFITRLQLLQCKKKNLEILHYYDESTLFYENSLSINLSEKELIDKLKSLFSELSTHMGTFSQQIFKGNYDLDARSSKSGGAYATYLQKDGQVTPYIYANLSNSIDDLRLLTHEAGHAFQFYMTDKKIPEYIIPMDSAEIFSFIMERFAWSKIDSILGENAHHYIISQLLAALSKMPYASAVDEFQHYLYDSPDVSMEERKSKWRDIENSYFPIKNYGDNKFLLRGGSFYLISHIFEEPFYFIDYDFAQLISIQFWQHMEKLDHTTWYDYEKLCKAGGSLSFLELLENANITSPFENDSIQNALLFVEKWLIKKGYFI